MTILCQVCGTANPDGTTYCEGCGVELTAAPTPAPAAMPETVLPEIVPQVAFPETSDGAVAPAVDVVPEAAAVALPTAEPSAEVALPTDSSVNPAPGTATEAPISEVPVSEAAAPVAEAPSAAPLLTGEAKLGIKKFGAPTGEVIPLQGERLVVGRFDASSGPVDIDLSSLGGQEHISRRHAELYREQGVWSVRDLGSTNGVYIRRRGETGFSPRLQEPAPLANGDELAFGNLMLIFHQS